MGYEHRLSAPGSQAAPSASGRVLLRLVVYSEPRFPRGAACIYRARRKNPGANFNVDLEMGDLRPKPLATALQAGVCFRNGVECDMVTITLIFALILL